jgi:regulator-associated protein of mTOR
MLTLFLMGSGAAQHMINVFNMDGKRLSSVSPYSGFLYQNRSAPISSTCFHPHRMLLSCSALNDNHVHIFSCDIKHHAPRDA